jgi:ABC-2 type transport system permease protein
MRRPLRAVRLEVVVALLRVSLLTALQYRASFLAEFLVGSLSAVGVAAPLFLVYARVPLIAGWNFDSALLVTGLFLLYNAFVAGLVEPNLGAIVDAVRTGELDYLLVRPVDAQLVISLRKVAPAAIWELVAGVVVLGIALSRVGVPGPGPLAAAAALFVSGLAATYGLWLLVICTSFWFVRVDNLRFLLSAITDAGRWPVSVYGPALRLLLTTLIPVALVSSYPAMALLGTLDGWLAAEAVLAAIGMLAASRWVLRRALRTYASASS